jgi:restriction modification system DNA specificity domain protein
MKTITVRDLGKVVTGHTPPTKEREYYGTFYPFVKPTDMIIGSKYTYVTEEGYSERGFQKYRSSLIPKGSTCVVCIGTLGDKMTMAHCDLFTNQSINSIIPSEQYDQHYVYYILKHNLNRVKALNKGTASGREFVSKTTFLDMPLIVIEDIDVQRRIGELLSAYDDLIENNQKQIKLLEEAAQRLYKEWFVDLHFPGYEDTPIVDGVPDGWTLRPISDFGEVVTGKTPSTQKKEYYGGNIPFVKIPDMHGCVYPVITESSLTEAGVKTQINKFIPRNSIMVSCIATVGLVNIAVEKCQTNQQINSIILSDERDLYFMFSAMSRLKELLEGVGSNGATMTNVNKTKFECLPALYPSEELRDSYYSFCKPIFEKIYNLSLSIVRLKNARDRLLPKLMSGEIEV